MEIKDLAGFSEPVTKLIESVSAGIGGIYKPLGTILNAKAESYKIKKIADAKEYEIYKIKESLTNNQGNLCVTDKNFELKLGSNSLESMALESLINKQIKNMVNIDSIVNKAIDLMKDKKEVSDIPVDNDWMYRFINSAQNISNDEIQNLWGKLLAGEVSKPNSYSLRTLEVLRNMTTYEAKVFVKIAKLTIDMGVNCIFNEKEFLNKVGIKDAELDLLKEIGIIKDSRYITLKSKQHLVFRYKDKAIHLDNTGIDDLSMIWISPFSSIGEELFTLIENNEEFDLSYVKKIVDFINFKNKDVKVSYSDIRWLNEYKYEYSDEKIPL